MKNIFILFLLSFCSCKTVDYLSENKYTSAINYLNSNLKDESFHVVDTLIYISLTNRFKEKKGVSNNLAQLDSLESLDKKYIFKNEYHSFNGKKAKSKKYNVYFSKPIGNILDVEIVNNKGNINYSYKYLTSFNTSILYRFTFNRNNKIVKVDKQEIIYN